MQCKKKIIHVNQNIILRHVSNNIIITEIERLKKYKDLCKIIIIGNTEKVHGKKIYIY